MISELFESFALSVNLDEGESRWKVLQHYLSCA
jgi:hypothetical protein